MSSHDPKLKQEAIRLVIEGGHTQANVARHLRVSENCVSTWVLAYKNKDRATLAKINDPDAQQRHFRNPALKKEAIRRVRMLGHHPAQVAQHMKIPRGTIDAWVSQSRQGQIVARRRMPKPETPKPTKPELSLQRS